MERFFLQFIIELCHRLSRKAIVEGVEELEEYALACELGIDMIQGYYYSRLAHSLKRWNLSWRRIICKRQAAENTKTSLLQVLRQACCYMGGLRG